LIEPIHPISIHLKKIDSRIEIAEIYTARCVEARRYGADGEHEISVSAFLVYPQYSDN
jgi:hypothetical protein